MRTLDHPPGVALTDPLEQPVGLGRLEGSPLTDQLDRQALRSGHYFLLVTRSPTATGVVPLYIATAETSSTDDTSASPRGMSS